MVIVFMCLQDHWPILRIVRSSVRQYPALYVTCIEWQALASILFAKMAMVRYPIIEYPNTAHALFTDTNSFSKIFNQVSLYMSYMYGWHVRQKWQLKLVVTVGLFLNFWQYLGYSSGVRHSLSTGPDFRFHSRQTADS